MAHDAHLRAALRNAPDARQGAPAHLSAQIVAAGYRAAGERPAAAARSAAAPRRPWRLGASGAFASLLLAGVLAGVIGVMWRDEPPPAVGERVAVTPPAAVVVAPALPDTAPVPRSAARPSAAAAAVEKSEARGDTARAAPSRQVLPPTTRPDSSRAVAPRGRAAADDVLAQAAPEVQAPPTPAPTSPVPAPSRVPAPSPALANLGAATDSARTESSARRSAASPPLAAALSLSATARPEAPWASALAAGAAVQWRIDGQLREAPVTWLAALAAQTRTRWQTSADLASAGDREVQWQQGDTLLGRLSLNSERVLWCDANGRCEAALLAQAVGTEMLKRLPR